MRVTNNQHPDQKFGINRRATRMAIKGLQVRPDRRQINKPVYRPQQMIRWHMPLNRKPIKQRLLFELPITHHHCDPPADISTESET
jgi:hypothetical protein